MFAIQTAFQAVPPVVLMQAQPYPDNSYAFGHIVVSALRPVVYAPAVRGMVYYTDPSGRTVRNVWTGVVGVAQLKRDETDVEMQARVKDINARIEKQHADAMAAAAAERDANRFDMIGQDWSGNFAWGMLRNQYMVDEGARKAAGLTYRGFAAYQADNQSGGSFGFISTMLDPVVHAVSSVSETAVHANTVAVEAEQFRQRQVVESTAINETMQVVIPAALAVMGGYAIYTAAGGGAAVAAASSETAATGAVVGAADAVTVSYTVEGVAGVATTGAATVETVGAGAGIWGAAQAVGESVVMQQAGKAVNNLINPKPQQSAAPVAAPVKADETTGAQYLIALALGVAGIAAGFLL